MGDETEDLGPGLPPTQATLTKDSEGPSPCMLGSCTQRPAFIMQLGYHCGVIREIIANINHPMCHDQGANLEPSTQSESYSDHGHPEPLREPWLLYSISPVHTLYKIR